MLRAHMVVLLMVFVAAAALAGEAPKTGVTPSTPSGRRVLRLDEWQSLLKRHEERTSSTLKFVEAARASASNTVVRVTARIHDLAPEGSVDDPKVRIETIELWGWNPVRTFVIERAEVSAVASWSRWDRLSWLNEIRVQDDGRWKLMPIYLGVNDLRRSPDPGISYPTPQTSVERAGKFGDWLQSYVAEAARERWTRAWPLYAPASRKLWEIRASVVEMLEREASAVIDVDDFTVVEQRRPDRLWGVTSKRHTVEIPDPQVLAALDKGTAVILHLDISGHDSESSLRGGSGELPIGLSFARIGR